MPPDDQLLSNAGLVLVALARRPDQRLRDLAAEIGITERAVQGIVNDLVSKGFLERMREGRRNRYIVRGDHPLTLPTGAGHEVSELLVALVPGPLVGPSHEECRALVLACSDYRYQDPLRTLLANQGLLGRAEVMLLPGGASALGGRDRSRIMAALEYMARALGAVRLLLVAHHGCWVPGAFISHRRDPFVTRRLVAERRRRTVDRVRDRLGLEPELWFLDERGASRVRFGRDEIGDPAHGVPARVAL
jgi:MarR family